MKAFIAVGCYLRLNVSHRRPAKRYIERNVISSKNMCECMNSESIGDHWLGVESDFMIIL
jgi:hypothetical protein